jgi:uncharacterized protein (DUF488 family)
VTRPAQLVNVGHSNRTLEELLDLLQAHGVKLLVDVRTLRGSRAFPHFDEERLRPALRKAGIAYAVAPLLAGRRGKQPTRWEPPCWQNVSFRNYADYMRTPEFRAGIRALLLKARRRRTALMCAEAVPWRCHRSLIADYLVVHKKRRVDELVGTRPRPHRLTVCARIADGKLRYDLP